ncbi:MAG: DNA-processing protein DprA [Aquificaceae bacterium]|jgi:DNA processing protein|uniref:DNA-processing protein DprA n=1 Tax=Hydrogenobacter sp. Uz 6-8 TaxID=3384828 RepID=UPI000F1E8990|nr:MAG: DNA-protecting protein DprA [Aquificota bacterium]
MEKLYNWLLLKAIRGLGEVSIKRLWLRAGSVERILSMSLEEASSLIGEERAKALIEKRLSFRPEEVIKLVEREAIGWLTLEDEEYPVLLREIEDPPPVLFWRGTQNKKPLIAVVGTRKPDLQSINFTRHMVRQIAQKGYAVASGGAYGIDMTAHVESQKYSGFTVCILGMGILRMPSYLHRLQEGVLFLSEFLPEVVPEDYTFPRRNRLISGISASVVVVEASERSGALITAEYALRQKKPLWAYIGNASSQRWLGCVKLVNEGKAKILYSAEALFDNLPTSDLKKDPLLELLTTPKTFDDLIEATGMEASELTLRLLQLEMEGRVSRSGSYYIAL